MAGRRHAPGPRRGAREGRGRGARRGRGPEPASIGLILSDDAELASLNADHMGKSGATDVLSFPLLPPSAFPDHPGKAPDAAAADDAGTAFALPPGSRPHLGDIVVSVERAIDQAEAGRGGQTGDVRWDAGRRAPAPRDPRHAARLRLGPRGAGGGGGDASAGAPPPRQGLIGRRQLPKAEISTVPAGVATPCVGHDRRLEHGRLPGIAAGVDHAGDVPDLLHRVLRVPLDAELHALAVDPGRAGRDALVVVGPAVDGRQPGRDDLAQPPALVAGVRPERDAERDDDRVGLADPQPGLDGPREDLAASRGEAGRVERDGPAS